MCLGSWFSISIRSTKSCTVSLHLSAADYMLQLFVCSLKKLIETWRTQVDIWISKRFSGATATQDTGPTSLTHRSFTRRSIQYNLKKLIVSTAVRCIRLWTSRSEFSTHPSVCSSAKNPCLMTQQSTNLTPLDVSQTIGQTSTEDANRGC